MRKIIILLCILLSTFIFSQESEDGEPLFNVLLNENTTWMQKSVFENLYLQTFDNQTINLPSVSSVIDKISVQNLDNTSLESVADKIQREENSAINIYGKIIDVERNISDVNKRFIYQDRYYNIVEITSETAQSLQVYFKDYNLPAGATLFVYDSQGIMTLGAFTSNNNPKSISSDGYNFITQPVIGKKIYLELSYPISAPEIPVLNLKSIVHGFKSLYSGPYGTAGNCHKNVACLFNSFNDKGRSIKSVGLVLANYKSNGNFAYSCSGALVNNAKQDGTPYFLTASHCIGPGNTGNYNWQNEFLVLFNYETKLCNDTNAPSTFTITKNSILGTDLLVDSSFDWKDFALLKLRTTKDIMARYKVCYAGWDNSPLAYTANTFDRYAVHHPKGDVKKISLVKDIFPANINFDAYSGGDYLAVAWKDGIVEQGSSGSPLFNSFDRLIGSLSRGRDPQIFNCDNPNKYTDSYLINTYARFSSNFLQMKQWLDPEFTSIQSIGPYCPAGQNISIGVPDTYSPPININYDGPVDINKAKVHPSQTFGKKIYVASDNYNFNPLTSISSDDIISTKGNLYDPVSNKLRLNGIYKVVDCNKIQYIDDSDVIIEMKNPISGGGYQDGIIVGVGNDKVIIKLSNGQNNNINQEIQVYKIVGKKLVFESWTQLSQNMPNYSFKFFYENNHLLVFNNTTKVLHSWYSISNGLASGTPLSFSEFIDVKMVDDKFFVSDVLGNYNDGTNKLRVYQFLPNSPNYTLINTFNNLYKTSSSTNTTAWKVLNVTKNNSKLNSYYINYIHRTQGDPFNRILELDLSNMSHNHLNLGSDTNLDFNVFGWTTYYSKIVGDKIFQLRAGNTNTGLNPAVRISIFKMNPSTGIWTVDKYQTFYQNIMYYAMNDKYIVQHTGTLTGISPYHILNVRELEYLYHPETIYNNSATETAAYNMIKDLTYDTFWKGILFGKDVYNNEISNTNFFPFNYTYMNGYNTGGTSMDNKTIILSDYTKPILGSKDVTAYGKYSVIMKPGFSVSSVTGVEFKAKVQKNLLTANIPSCSLTFEDMLNPQLKEYTQQIYLKQLNSKSDSPHYGEIILNSKDPDHEIIIDRDIKLYPNPTRDILNIDFNGKHFKTLEVYSIDARKIMSMDISGKNIIEVNLSSYPSGIYMVNLTDANGKTYPNKVIKK